MVRRRLAELCDNAEIISACRRDLARAEQNLTSDFTVKRDCMCCGNAARLVACSNIGAKNEQLYNILFGRIKSDSVVLLHPCDTADCNCGLMQGLAGVYYAVAMYGDSRSGGMLC